MNASQKKMQTEKMRSSTRSFLATFKTLTLVVLFTAFAGIMTMPGNVRASEAGSPTPLLPLPTGGGAVSFDLSSSAYNGTVDIYIDEGWSASNPSCTFNAELDATGSSVHCSVGSESCVPYGYQEIAVVNIRNQDGTMNSSHMVYTADGGTTVLAINIE